MINLRNALMTGKRLPYDAEVEYLESTGTQYIDCIGLRVESADTIVCNFASLEPTADIKYYGLMCYGGVNGTGAVIGYNSGSALASYQSKYRLGYLGTTFKLTKKAIDSNFHLTEWGPSGFSVDGVLADSLNHANFEIPSGYSAQDFHFPIFGFAQASQNRLTFSKSKMRLAHFAISGKIDLIPVRKGTVGYLYDRVSGKLFGNAGTGDFVLGPDIVPVEWLGFGGAQYFSTGVYAIEDTRIEARLKTISTGNKNWFGGTLTGSGRSASGFVFNSLNSNTIEYLFGNSGWKTAYSSAGVVGKVFDLDFGKDAVKVDGTTISTPSYTAFDTQTAAILLGVRYAGSAYITGQVYWFDICEGQTAIRKFRPVRVGTEGAMMDVLTRRIYRNQGTGAFTYGNDLKYPIPAE